MPYAGLCRCEHQQGRQYRDELWEAAWKGDEDALTWSKSKPGIRELLEKYRWALEIWREGSERSDALYHQPA